MLPPSPMPSPVSHFLLCPHALKSGNVLSVFWETGLTQCRGNQLLLVSTILWEHAGRKDTPCCLLWSRLPTRWGNSVHFESAWSKHRCRHGEAAWAVVPACTADSESLWQQLWSRGVGEEARLLLKVSFWNVFYGELNIYLHWCSLVLARGRRLRADLASPAPQVWIDGGKHATLCSLWYPKPHFAPTRVWKVRFWETEGWVVLLQRGGPQLLIFFRWWPEIELRWLSGNFGPPGF